MKKNISLKLGCDFPVLYYNAIDYKTVLSRKLSLPAYMMLVYIKGAPEGSFLCHELREAGVDSELYDIFSDELFNLAVSHKMLYPSPSLGNLHCAEQYRDAFDKFKTSDFSLTQRGEICFRDRVISGNYQTKRLRSLYYDYAKGSFALKAAVRNLTDIPFEEMKYSMKDPDRESILDFLNSSRRELRLGDDSMIVDIDDCLDTGFLSHQEKINIDITVDGAVFTCRDEAYLEFLTRHYKSEWISGIVSECAGKFSFFAPQTVSFEDISDNAEDMIMPKDIGSILSARCDYLITGRHISTSGHNVKASSVVDSECGRQILDGVAADCELIMISGNTARSYHAVNMKVPRCGLKGLGFTMDVLIGMEIGADKFHTILSTLKPASKPQSFAVGGLVSREWRALESMTGRKECMDNIHLLTNYAKMSGLISIETARRLESLNRAYKSRRNTTDNHTDVDAKHLGEWADAVNELESKI